MKKVIYKRFSKQEIAGLPLAEFDGRIVVIFSEGEAERAVDFLLTQPFLGIDTETRPSFRRGKLNQVSLLQVATDEICFLFRLNMMGITPAIVRLLENTEVPMIGLSLKDDIVSLKRRQNFTPGRFIDLQKMVGQLGIEDMSLQKLYANFFGQKISKRQQLTNWDADVLSDRQKRYAATDAWACIQMYREIGRLEATHDYELIENEEV
ncbi:MAG: 3'-5' exonuclease domain-containing protein 2 [Prevotella sp.]|nr:3'-5' exonuclease domain-containing protein 2 [Prevotella sp.]MBR6455494.1 3'-5' exonuclease domain-containing protein 2 [Prevotella sp.]